MLTNIFDPYMSWTEAVSCGCGMNYFRDKDLNWWDAYFRNDVQSPFREESAIVKIDFEPGGRIRSPTSSRPSFCKFGARRIGGQW